LSYDECNEENKAHAATRNRESPFNEWALAMKNIAEYHDATLPTVLLVKRQDVGDGQEVVHETKASALGQDCSQEVGGYSGKEYNYLLV
jgi:hypothetical protein